MKAGPGRPKGSKNKATAEIKELALQHAPAAFSRIVELSMSADLKVALAASQVILDRAYGKPALELQHTGKDGGPLVVSWLSGS